MIDVKICGLRSESMIDAALDAGAQRIGLVLVPSSPRAVNFAVAARLVAYVEQRGGEAWAVAAWSASGGPTIEGLEAFVEANPGLAAVQLHGRETPGDLEAFRRRVRGPKLIKAIGVATVDDLRASAAFAAADGLLLDARAPAGSSREGGLGRSFDWSLLASAELDRPWTLSGGLTPQNVAAAIAMSGAQAVDVSSGVESAPGVKDPAKISAFIAAARRPAALRSVI